VDFTLIKGKKGKGTTIATPEGEYEPEVYNTIARGVGKCLCCGNIIEDDVIKSQAQNGGLGHQLYAVAFKQGKGSLDFRIPDTGDLDGDEKAQRFLEESYLVNYSYLIPSIDIPIGEETERLPNIGIEKWDKLFNPRQLLTLVTYLSRTQWYLLAWDAFKAREFPFDEARQLALAVGGFNLTDLAKTHKLIETKSGECILLAPSQRLKKRAFSTGVQDFSLTYLVDGLHAALAIYEEEGNLQQVRQFIQKTGLVSDDRFMKTLEVAFKVIPDKAKEKDIVSVQGVVRQLGILSQQKNSLWAAEREKRYLS
jgi:hypothetical protein